MTLGEKIISLRKQRGLSQEELAITLGISRQAVSKWETEDATPDTDKVIALADYFNVTTDWLLRDVEPPETHAVTDAHMSPVQARAGAPLLLCLTLLCGCARADWADDTADALCARMTALAGERAYVEMFTGSSELMSHVERMAGNAGCEVQQRRRFVLRDESAFEDFAAAQGADMPELSDTAQAELKMRLALLMPSLLTGQAGAEWLAASNVLMVSQTMVMPEDFSPLLLVTDYGTDVDILTAFAQTGQDTITAQSVFVPADIVDAGMDTVLLLYTEDEPEE